MSRKSGAGELGQYPRKGFWALIGTQFQGAFNDNLFQYLIIYYLLASFMTGAAGNGDGTVSFLGWRMAADDFVPGFAKFLFSVPFIVFPAVFGALSDRYSKGSIAQLTKYIEIGIMVLGGVAFYLGSPLFLWCVLFLMATQSAMFGPAKYGILPEILPESRLSWGNGILQMGTLVAIIAGIGLAGPVYGLMKEGPHQTAYVLVVLSVLGAATALMITRPPAANPAQKVPVNPLTPWAGMGRYLKVIFEDKVLLNVVIGYTYFWLVGSLAQQTVMKYSMSTMHYGEARTSYLLSAVALGIGIGALAAGYLSRGKIEQGFILIGAVGMAVFGMFIALPAAFFEGYFLPAIGMALSPLLGGLLGGFVQSAGAYYLLLLASIFALGLFAGMFDVPLAATLQQRAPKRMKGGVIAATNMLTFVGMAAAAIMYMTMGKLGMTPLHIFMAISVASILMGAYIAWKIPLLVLRAVLWPLDGTLFKLLVSGRRHLPEQGGALLVSDHDSIVDTLPLQMSTDREICFVVGADALETPWIRRLCRFLHVIPVDSRSDAGLVEGAARIKGALAEGWVVCVSRERRLHRDGMDVPWFKDYELLTSGSGCPVIPVSVTRLWERVYVFRDNRIQWRWWGRLRYPVQVRFGESAAPGTPAWKARQAVERTGMEAYMERPYEFRVVQHGFVRMARRNLRRMAIADAMTGSLSYFKTLAGSIVFARKLKVILGKEEMVGLLVPPTVGGALANIAVQMLGKAPVNLNYTAPSETIASCARRCGITHTLTSRKFLEKLPLDVPGIPVYLEDIRETVTGKDRIAGMLLALLAPVHLLDRILGAPRRRDTDLATIIFSSGSEGEPKGVMLSHRNVMTIIESAQEIFPHDRNSCVVGFLPLFHSFGYTVCLWTPLVVGIRAVYHPNPLEPKAIGGLIQKHGGSIMIGTSTFLQGFIRRCEAEQLKSLDFVVCGAEKLPERVRLAFNEKFGMEPVEGYGTTECAPGVSVNIPDCASPGFFVVGLKHGTIGRPMTGQTVRVVDPDTGAELGVNEPGLLLVTGPNIMQGYLDNPAKTAAVLHDGWYATGDIAGVDEEGFISITDRLARFSKIGGEMVPHTRVEESLHSLLGLTEQSLVVASVPDTAKGERLVVLHILEDAQLEELLRRLDASDMPNLWRPKASAFYRIDAIPVLGTGKMDIKQAKKLAQALDVGE